MKGIDKKACRSFLNPRRSLDLNSGLFYVEQIEYIVCTAIRIVGHRKLLILDFYPRAEAVKGMTSPDFTMFQATDDFITFDHRDGVKTRWRTAILDNLERTYNFIFKCAFYSRPDEEDGGNGVADDSERCQLDVFQLPHPARSQEQGRAFVGTSRLHGDLQQQPG